MYFCCKTKINIGLTKMKLLERKALLWNIFSNYFKIIGYINIIDKRKQEGRMKKDNFSFFLIFILKRFSILYCLT